MWKTLRNLALAVVLLAGILKLLVWYSVGQDLPRVLARLAPYAQLKYANLSTNLNGDVTLTNVDIQPAAEPRSYRADSLTFSGPNLFWLIKHSLLHEDRLPDSFTLSADNLKFPAASPWLHQPWLDLRTFVPFPNLGCDGATLGPSDYRRMGLHANSNHAVVNFSYDDVAHKLDLGLTLQVPRFSETSADIEFSHFDPLRLSSPTLAETLRLDQVSVDYADLGYMKRRVQYCADRAGISAAQFVDKHVNAALALLQQHGIQPSDALTQLYRRLVQQGGSISALSLPTRDFVFGAWDKIGRDAVWRQLNVTVRYETAPPIMFNLAFSPQPAPAAPTSVNPPAAASITPIGKPVVETVIPHIKQPSALHPLSRLPAPALAATHGPVAAPPAQARIGKAAETDSPRSAGPLHPVRSGTPSILDDPDLPVVPSSPRPPPGSTLALVWKPTIEQLPAPTPLKRDYQVIGFDQLQHEIGRRIRLITAGDNRVEGRVLRVDSTEVRLLVQRGGGDAKFDVARSRIRQIELLRP